MLGRVPTLFDIQLAKRDSLVVQFKSFLGSRERARITETAESDESLSIDVRTQFDRGPNLRLLILKLSDVDVKTAGLDLDDYELRPMKTVQQMVDEALQQKPPPRTSGLKLDLTESEILEMQKHRRTLRTLGTMSADSAARQNQQGNSYKNIWSI